MQATWKTRQLWSWTTGLFVGASLLAGSAQAISPPRMMTKKELKEYTHLVVKGNIVEKKVVEFKATNDVSTTIWLRVSSVDVKNKKYAGFLKKGSLLRFFRSCQTKPVQGKPKITKPARARWVKGPDGRKIWVSSAPPRVPFGRSKRRCASFRYEGSAPLMQKKGSEIKLPLHVMMYSGKAEYSTVPLMTTWGRPLRGLLVKAVKGN
ncbi:MAG: hypothetical protein H6728_05300 [Myxococcales bacterium]|nr:hypothetical protein [Myxococcales bacterium]